MGAVVELMEKDLAHKLPKKFGFAFDGWSDHCVHYLAVFALGDFVPYEGCVLPGFSPFEQEDDLSSDQHGLYLTNLVQHYEQCVNNVIFLVGDNCSTNRKFARDHGIPLIGCNSHKLNLAVNWFLGMDKRDDNIPDAQCTAVQLDCCQLLKVLSNLMSKLKTIKGKAKLQEYTDWVAIWANETCWNGNYWMCNWFFEFKEAIKELAAEEGSSITTEIAELLPSNDDALKISELTKDLKKFHSISLLL
jgi:hypothetical protein